jgi:hypothetical protein
MRAIEALRVVLGLDLSPADKLTLMAIIHSIDWETWRGQVSIKQLSGMSRVSTASIKRALASLTEKKLIDRERHMTRYGEASAVTIVNVENLNDFAVAHDEPTLAHSEPTLAHGEPTLAHGDTSMAHSEPTLAHGDTSMAHGEPPLSVLPVVSSVSPVHQSVDKPVERPVVMTPPPSETPRAETAAAPRWRTIPQAQRYSHQVIYYKLLDGLGYAPKQILHLRNVLQDALIYPDQQDIQAFLLTYEH